MFFYSRSVEGDAKVKTSEPSDAAALIAEALKRKFAHRYRHSSGQEDKGDLKLPVPSMKPQTETPLVRFFFTFIILSDKKLCLHSRFSDLYQKARDRFKTDRFIPD